jgi:CheY-like chemotaxis protein
VPSHILVVDDTPELLAILENTLRKEGHRVTTAASAPQALAVLDGDPPDLLISDIMMPEMDGFQLLELVRGRQRFAALPVIFLTASDNIAVEERARTLGVEHFLDKPVNNRRLVATVRGTLERIAQLRSQGLLRKPSDVPPAWDAVPTGIEPLDDLTGGLPRGRCYYTGGDVGTGKMVLGIQFVHYALRRGEAAVLVTTDRPSALLRTAEAMDLKLDGFIDDGKLVLLELTTGLDRLVESPEDLRLVVEELTQYANEVQATRLAFGSILTLLAGSNQLNLSATLISGFLRALEDAGLTVMLMGDPPATPEEQLAEAFLRRSSFGSIRLERPPGNDELRVLTVERLLSSEGRTAVRHYRVERGVGLASVDRVGGALVARIGEAIDRARREKSDEALADDPIRGVHVREGWAATVRDCVTQALDARDRCGLLVAKLAAADAGPLLATELPAAVGDLLGPDDVVRWVGDDQLFVFGLGADHAAMTKLADRIQQRMGELAIARNAEPPNLRCAVASLSARERGERGMLDSLRQIAPRQSHHVA